MNKFMKLLLSIGCAVLFFWIYKAGVWVGALTTQRTEFYYTIHAVGAWACAIFVGIAIFVQPDNA
jgi:hypothetical protein